MDAKLRTWIAGPINPLTLARIAAGPLICLIVTQAGAQAPTLQDQLDLRQEASIAQSEACRDSGIGCIGQPGPGTQGPFLSLRPPDPCFMKQNAMRPCTTEAPQKTDAVVDPNVVGTWEFPMQQGPWVWEIFPNGTYVFHSEAGDDAPSHAGTFSASNGHWSLKATSGLPGYTDGGTYRTEPPNTWVPTGRLGQGTWHIRKVRHASSVKAP